MGRGGQKRRGLVQHLDVNEGQAARLGLAKGVMGRKAGVGMVVTGESVVVRYLLARFVCGCQ